MNLYLISQSVNQDYDTYDSAVVAADSEQAARYIHPTMKSPVVSWELAIQDWWSGGFGYHNWAHPKDVQVKLIGTTDLPVGVICASFNAG